MHVILNKTRLLHALAVLLAVGHLACPSHAKNATVATSGTLEIQLAREHTGGGLKILLFDSAENFENFSSPIRAERFPADGRKSLAIDNVPAGEYALLVYHDENDNRQLDVNFINIPREPIGFSNTYRPRGAPTFRNARFAFHPDKTEPIEMDLARPLGDRGRIGAGAVVITRGSPYAQSTDNPLNILPAVVYIGNRLQIQGPFAQIGLIGSGKTRLAGTVAYRQATFQESNSPVLTGMRNRRATAMAGLRVQHNTIGGINLSAGYQLDALDRIGGGEGRLGISRPIPWKKLRFSPSLSVNYMLPRLARHDYGVTPAEATAQRPAYRPGTAINPEVGFSILAEITPNIMGAAMSSVEWFDSSIRNSPIVDDHYVIKGMAFVVYMF